MEKAALLVGTISIWAVMILTAESLTLDAPKTSLLDWEIDNKNSYTGMLGKLRTAAQGGTKCHNIPMMAKKPNNGIAYFIVNLKQGSVTIRVALRATDLYVVGYADTYGAKERAFFFKDTDIKTDAFQQFNAKVEDRLPYTSSYKDLENSLNAGSRKELDLTKAAIKGLVGDIYGKETSELKKALKHKQAQFLLSATQMISEAVRFKYIGDKVTNNYDRVCDPSDSKCKAEIKGDAKMVTLEGNWAKISKAVVSKADKNGGFNPAVEFSTQNGEDVIYSDVKKVADDVAQLAYVDGDCKKKLSTLENVIASDWALPLPLPLLLEQA